jgi:uncharacterized protein (TIGR02996 family)
MNEAFLTAIRETPDDDTPRLVYADWLEENGDPARAEFIRSSCAARRLPEWSEERERAEDRAAQLFAEHASRWLGEIPEGLENSLVERGFWKQLTFGKPAAFLAAVERRPLQDLAPVQTLRLDPKPARIPGFDDLLGSAALAWVETLTVDDAGFNDDVASKLAASPHAPRLRSLFVYDGRSLTTDGVSALLAEDALPSLATLWLRNAGLGDEGIRQIARSPGLGRLRRLGLELCGFGGAGAEALVESKHVGQLEELSTLLGDSALAAMSRSRGLAGLKRLSLEYVGARPASWQAFARSELAGRLSHLDVAQTRLGPGETEALFHGARFGLDSLGLSAMRFSPEALELLLRSPVLHGVRKLDLSSLSDSFGEQGAKMLAQNPPSERLRDLNLSFNRIGIAGAEALADGRALSGLRALRLMGNGIGPAGVERLARSDALAGLRTVVLFNNRLGDEGIAALEDATFAGSLRTLSLGASGLTAAGVVRLVHSERFPRLQELNLNENQIGVEGVRALLKSPLCESLRVLCLDSEDVSDRQLARLRRRFGARLYVLTAADYS